MKYKYNIDDENYDFVNSIYSIERGVEGEYAEWENDPEIIAFRKCIYATKLIQALFP